MRAIFQLTMVPTVMSGEPEYVEHYNTERNHQGIGNVIPMPARGAGEAGETPVVRRKRLGGLLSYYQREAA